MSQCIRRLLSNTFRTPCPDRRAIHTSAPVASKKSKRKPVHARKEPEHAVEEPVHATKKPVYNTGKPVYTTEELLQNGKGTKQWPKTGLADSFRTEFLPTFPPPLKPFRRRIDEQAQEELYEMFYFLLRNSAATDYGLQTRPDGYLSLSKLFNYPLFRFMDMFKLQEIVNRGKKYRLHIKYDPRRLGGPWWIRAQMFNEQHFVLTPALLSNANGLAVYRTSLQNWESYISRTGIARFDDDYIRLDPIIPNSNYIENMEDEAEVFIFLDIHLCILHGLRFFYRIASSQKRSSTTPVLTKGDSLGIIPPSLFSQVKIVDAKKRLVWGVAHPLAQKSWSVEPDDIDQHGLRKTLLPVIKKNIHGFVDFYDEDDIENRPVHPDTIKEAMEVVSSDV